MGKVMKVRYSEAEALNHTTLHSDAAVTCPHPQTIHTHTHTLPLYQRSRRNSRTQAIIQHTHTQMTKHWTLNERLQIIWWVKWWRWDILRLKRWITRLFIQMLELNAPAVTCPHPQTTHTHTHTLPLYQRSRRNSRTQAIIQHTHTLFWGLRAGVCVCEKCI